MVLKSVNFHFWPYCNFACAYCFARFENLSSHLSFEQCREVIELLARAGIRKINLAGGEPTLSPYLGGLIECGKKCGLTTSIISNGTGITGTFLEKYKDSLDWIGLSIDSGIEEINRKLGRGNGRLVENILNRSRKIREAGIQLKINTVVSQWNYREDMTWLIGELRPARWKVFQLLPIAHHNSSRIGRLKITDAQFEYFVQNHAHLKPIAESNNMMLNSYLMIDPQGRFYQNSRNIYRFSEPILKVGVDRALNEISYDPIKYEERGGIYAW